MRLTSIFLISFVMISQTFAQNFSTPLEKNNYQKVTSYDDLSTFIKQLDESSDLLKVETIGQSVQGRNLYALKFSTTEFGKDKSKIKILFCAQQHGNEQSGKEGALLLAQTLLKPENKYLFDKIDFALVPQMNPDGSEKNERRNGNNMDMNRNHMIMTEPEVLALHKFFDQYLFEANMDIHEYWPYGDEWKKYGYRRNADITVGSLTNPNISQKIRDLSNSDIVPFVFKCVKDKGFSTFIYCPGGPPELDYIRHSTFDVNDGRQSFGITSTFGFIQEGINGFDTYTDNLKRRTESQMTGMISMIQYFYNHKDEIKKIVNRERKNLISGKSNQNVSIQSEHVQNGQKLSIPLYSYYSKTDSTVIVNDYRPVVKSIYDVKKPLGYLIPKQNKELIEWADKHALIISEYRKSNNHKIEQYTINSIDSMDFERDIIINSNVEAKEFQGNFNPSDYIYIPTNQLKANMIVLALEPKSELGLVTYKQFEHLLKVGTAFPVLRIIKK